MSFFVINNIEKETLVFNFWDEKKKQVDLTFPIPPLDSKYRVMPADFLGLFFCSAFETFFYQWHL